MSKRSFEIVALSLSREDVVATVNQSSRARADLQEIWDFVARDDRAAAARVLREIRDRFKLLARNPLLGAEAPATIRVRWTTWNRDLLLRSLIT